VVGTKLGTVCLPHRPFFFEGPDLTRGWNIGLSRLPSPYTTPPTTVDPNVTDVGTDSGWLVAVGSAGAPIAVRVFAPFAVSVAGAAALPLAVWSDLRSAWLAVRGPVPVFAEASGAPAPVSRRAWPAAVGISCPV
jgi:hypothetical protein